MKLYLSSYQIGNAPERLQELVGTNKTAAVIMNATDGYGDSQRPKYLRRQIDALSEIGISGTDVDLRRYFGEPDKLRKALSAVGLLWVVGGNTFVLRRAMRETGLDQTLLANRDVVYGGFSAGICVLSPSLHGIHLGDEPYKIPDGYPSDVIWNGIGVIDFYIVPHFRSPHPESGATEKVAEHYENAGLPHYRLRDGEAIVVEDGCTVEIVGKPQSG